MSYRPGPVRQVLIPKEGKPGATRPLGISNLKDKLIQKGFQELLETIYAPIFLERFGDQLIVIIDVAEGANKPYHFSRSE